MANYVKSTDFAAKDALLTGDPLKIVSGTEIDDEYNAIQTAINSKANTNSPALTGSPTAPTATEGTNTTQLATTAFIQAALTALKPTLWPVGSIYTNATSNTNPATLLGFGTWEAFGAGRVMVGFNAADPLFDTAQETGGSKDAVLVSHTHTATTAITDPGHLHGTAFGKGNTSYNPSGGAYADNSPTETKNSNSATTGITAATTNSTEGVSGTNANLQPYITVYLWRRTA